MHIRLLLFFLVAILSHSAEGQSSLTRGWQIRCENPADCLPGVGGLISPKGVCSAFFLTSDIVATNYHCLPAAEAELKQSCLGKVAFVFPETGQFKQESFDCEKLIYASAPAVTGFAGIPDYAFFKIMGRTTRTALIVNREGFRDGLKVHIRKVDFDSKNRSAKIRPVACAAIQNSLADPVFKSPLSSVVLLENGCPIIPGNSGSPMLTEDHQAIGVVSASVSYARARKAYAFGFGSNFACLNTGFLGVGYGIPDECLNINSTVETMQAQQELLAKAYGKINKDLQVELNEMAAKFLKDLPPAAKNLRWRIDELSITSADRQAGINRRYALRPECLFSTPTQRASAVIALPLELPGLQFNEDLDNEARLRLRLSRFSEAFYLRMQFSEGKWKAEMKSVKNPAESRTLDLAACSSVR